MTEGPHSADDMSISSHLARHFSAGVRQRGQAYFGGGQVRMLQGSATEFEARVRGTETYEVMLEVRGSSLRLQCDCPHFETGEPCKHLWAAILAAEKLRYLSAAASVTTVVTRPTFTAPMDAELTGATSLYPPPAPWRSRLSELMQNVPDRSGAASWRWPAHRQIVYLIDRRATSENGALSLGLYTRERRSDGEWGRMTPLSLRRVDIPRLPDTADHTILAAISGALMTYNYAWAGQNQVPGSAMIDVPLARLVIPEAARAGRLFLRDNGGTRETTPVTWNDNAWNFTLEVEKGEGSWRLQGLLRRGDESIPVAQAEMITRGGFVFTRVAEAEDVVDAMAPEPDDEDRRHYTEGPIEVSPLASGADFEWIKQLDGGRPIEVPDAERDEFIASLLNAPHLPQLRVPEELQFEEVTGAPQPVLRISSDKNDTRNMRAVMSFDYAGHAIPQQAEGSGVYDGAARRYIRRDAAGERAASELLSALGGRYQSWYNDVHWQLPSARLPRIIRNLVTEHWHVETDGKAFRQAGEVRLDVTSGVDWFDLSGEVDYGGTTAKLPQLLAALRRGDNMVRLWDGAFGLLPEEWLKRFGLIAGLGEAVNGNMRFRRSQAGLLDALLAAQPEARCDEAFARHARRDSDVFRSASGCAAGRVLRDNCAIISAKGSGGWSSCASLDLAGAWRTTWALGRRRRCWRCWKTGGL